MQKLSYAGAPDDNCADTCYCKHKRRIADGKKLEKAECVPEKVNILAEPSLVHSIVALHTKNVDLSQLRSDSTIDVELELPERVMCETKTVTVRFITEN